MNIMANKEILATATPNDPRWASVVARDSLANGKFVYSVKTTGVYCRPSCAARTARPENVRFHADCADAERAGFRPCKRCKPDQPTLVEQHAAKVAGICRLIESAEIVPGLEELARHAGLSTYHFHRVFKAATGHLRDAKQFDAKTHISGEFDVLDSDALDAFELHVIECDLGAESD